MIQLIVQLEQIIKVHEMLMSQKPTYEELEKKIQELEKAESLFLRTLQGEDALVLKEEWRVFYDDDALDASYGSEEFITYLLGAASVAHSRDDLEEAELYLSNALSRLSEELQGNSVATHSEMKLMRAAFLYWEINQELVADTILALLPDFLISTGRSRGCTDAVLAVKQAIMFGDMAKANEYSDYLIGQGYRYPGFMRLCKQYSLCEGR